MENYRTIGEVSEQLNIQPHVLRFWESKFKQISPQKRGGGRRYYRPQDIDLIKRIHHLLHTQGYTIKGVQKLLVKDRQLTGSVEGMTPAIQPQQDVNPVAKDIIQRINATSVAATPIATTPIATTPAASTSSSVANQSDLKLILNRLKTLRTQISERC